MTVRDDVDDPKAKSVIPGGGVKCKTKFKIIHISGGKFSLEETRESAPVLERGDNAVVGGGVSETHTCDSSSTFAKIMGLKI